MAGMRFYKYQALGNDMVVIDPADVDFALSPAAIRLICQRHFGPGADGICYGPLPDDDPSPRRLRFFNPDGSEAKKSGNGLRIFARYLWDRGYVRGRDFEIKMGGDLIQVHIEDETANAITTTLGKLSFSSGDVPVSGPLRELIDANSRYLGLRLNDDFLVTTVSAGNPHCVLFRNGVTQAQLEAHAKEDGPAIEMAGVFPHRTNVQFARVIDEHTIEIAIWERGAGYTLASGTSASAAAGAAIKTGRCQSPVEVRMPGGAARVSIDDDWNVTLSGDVQALYQGTFSPDFLKALVSG